jgi:acyl carrier protein
MSGLRLGRLRNVLPESPASASGGGSDFHSQLTDVAGSALATVIEDRLATHLSRIIGLGKTPLDRLKPVGNLGLDSLMAVELGHVLETDLGIAVPMMKLIQNRTTEDMARELAHMVEQHRRKSPEAVNKNI